MSEENKKFDSEEEKIDDTSYTENDNKVKNEKKAFKGILTAAIAAIAISTFFGGYFLGTLENSESDVTNEDLEKILLEMNTKIVQSPQPVQQPQASETPPRINISLDDDPVKGDTNAPITIVEFSDFQCPFCSRFFVQTLPLIDENYIKTGKVKLVYRDLPLSSIHPNARAAHTAAECADEQGQFWSYHDVLFQTQNEWQSLSSIDAENKFIQYASALELQISNFKSCISSLEISEEINKDLADSISYGVTGTPAFFIGNDEKGYVKITGAQPFNVFKAIIDKQLAP